MQFTGELTLYLWFLLRRRRKNERRTNLVESSQIYLSPALRMRVDLTYQSIVDVSSWQVEERLTTRKLGDVDKLASDRYAGGVHVAMPDRIRVSSYSFFSRFLCLRDHAHGPHPGSLSPPCSIKCCHSSSHTWCVAYSTGGHTYA